MIDIPSGTNRVTLMEQSHHLLPEISQQLDMLPYVMFWGVHLLGASLTGLIYLILPAGEQIMGVFSWNAQPAKCNGQA